MVWRSPPIAVIWRREADNRTVKFGKPEPAGSPPIVRAIGIESVASPFSSDRKRAIVASGSWDNTVKTWAAATGQLQADCLAYPNQAVALVVSPEGTARCVAFA